MLLGKIVILQNILEPILIFFIIYLLVFVVYYFFLCRKKKRKKQKGPKGFKITNEMNYLITKFKLDEKSLDIKKLAKGVALINAFIIAFVSTILINLKLQTILRLLIGFVLLFILIYACYEIYGNYLKKGRK